MISLDDIEQQKNCLTTYWLLYDTGGIRLEKEQEEETEEIKKEKLQTRFCDDIKVY